jgi:hypothetical protein
MVFSSLMNDRLTRIAIYFLLRLSSLNTIHRIPVPSVIIAIKHAIVMNVNYDGQVKPSM